jgi:hypothetical protein
MQRPSADCGQKQDPGGGMQDAEGKKKRCFRIKEGRKEEKDRGLTFYGPLQKSILASESFVGNYQAAG